ncbi:MAG: LuxR C-terminal-related transcriptional regulator [Thermomicrobiales bacterium]
MFAWAHWDESAIHAAWLAGRQLSVAEAIAEIRALTPTEDSARPPEQSAVKLSPRELEVPRPLVAGEPDRAIAEALFLSVRTVANEVLIYLDWDDGKPAWLFARSDDLREAMVRAGVTYEVEVLANWEQSLDMAFGTAHLFIDGLVDCPDDAIDCYNRGELVGGIDGDSFGNVRENYYMEGDRPGYVVCVPCDPRDVRGNTKDDMTNVFLYRGNHCNQRFAARDGNCLPVSWCRGPCPDFYD